MISSSRFQFVFRPRCLSSCLWRGAAFQASHQKDFLGGQSRDSTHRIGLGSERKGVKSQKNLDEGSAKGLDGWMDE